MKCAPFVGDDHLGASRECPVKRHCLEIKECEGARYRCDGCPDRKTCDQINWCMNQGDFP